jgi:hypothetical protein
MKFYFVFLLNIINVVQKKNENFLKFFIKGFYFNADGSVKNL